MIQDKNLKAHMDAAVIHDMFMRSITLPDFYTRESIEILKHLLNEVLDTEPQETVQKLIEAYIAYLNDTE